MISDMLGAAQLLGLRSDDDYVDRLHYYFTGNVLLALTFLVSYKQFGGKPIECMTPKMYADSWEDYAENFCWAQDTYYLPMSEKVMTTNEKDRYKDMISYYQWVPFFLLFSAACFRLPSILWKYSAGHSGIQIHDLVDMATDQKNLEPDMRKTNLRSLANHLQKALRFHRRLVKKKVKPHKYLLPLNMPYTAFFVTFIYISVKLLYLGNVIFHLFLMNYFLGMSSGSKSTGTKGSYALYGFGAFADILLGKPWETSGLFPRISYCDFDIRMMGSNVQRYSIQCVLVINIFNEKIFVFLWFWYLCLLALTFLSMVYWLFIMAVPPFSRWFVSRQLELSELIYDPVQSRKDVDRFVNGYLRTDGIFIMRMINSHAGILFGTDLTLCLWKTFYNIEDKARRQLSSPFTPSPAVNSDGAAQQDQLPGQIEIRRPKLKELQKTESTKSSTKSDVRKSSKKSSKSLQKSESVNVKLNSELNDLTESPNQDNSKETDRLIGDGNPEINQDDAGSDAPALTTTLDLLDDLADESDDEREDAASGEVTDNSSQDGELPKPPIAALAFPPLDQVERGRLSRRRPRSRSPLVLSPLNRLSPLSDSIPALSGGLIPYSQLTPSQIQASTLLHGQQQLPANTPRTLAHRIGRRTTGVVGLPRSSSNSRDARQTRQRTDTGRRAAARTGQQ